MKILYLLSEGPDGLWTRLVKVQAKEHEVTVIDLSRGELPHDTIVDAIWAHDRVISW